MWTPAFAFHVLTLFSLPRVALLQKPRIRLRVHTDVYALGLFLFSSLCETLAWQCTVHIFFNVVAHFRKKDEGWLIGERVSLL